MSKKIDLTGKTFGRLTVISEVGKNKHGGVVWNCECSCGNVKVVVGSSLRKGYTKSCGCFRVENSTNCGLAHHPLYNVWYQMKDRCSNEKNPMYLYYGGRGIKVCDSWFYSLENFIQDMYLTYHKGLELDRINNDGNYEPDNCRWATPKQNAMNKGKYRNGSSKYKGIHWKKKDTKWYAQIHKDGIQYYLGSFVYETDAALAYNEKAEELFGEYAYLNLIEK